MIALLRLTGRRLVALPVMVLGVTLLVFVVMRFAPTDAATNALGESATDAAKALYRTQHGLNDPMLVQYGRFLVGLVHGDLGMTVPPSQKVRGGPADGPMESSPSPAWTVSAPP